MKKRITALLIVAIMMVAIIPTALAAAGTEADPNVGGVSYGNAYAGSIVLEKYDLNAWEKAKVLALNPDDEDDGVQTVTYTPKDATGWQLSGTDVVGTYVTDKDPDTDVDVTYDELSGLLTNIPFKIEHVQLIAGKDMGSVDPEDYEVVTTDNVVTDGGVATTDDYGVITWTGLAQGYYRISELANSTATPAHFKHNPFIVSVPTAAKGDEYTASKTVYVYPKNRAVPPPDIDKTVEAPTEIVNGNKFTFTIQSELPATLKATQGFQKYVITDTMINGLTYANNLSVYYKPVGGGANVALTVVDDYTVVGAAGGQSLQITLTAAGFAKLAAGDDVSSVVAAEGGKYYLYAKYDTLIDLNTIDLSGDGVTITNLPKNQAELDFTNDGNTSYENDVPPVTVNEFAAINIEKTDGATSVALAGAQFKVYTALTGTAPDQVVDPASALQDETGEADLVLTTAANGTVSFNVGVAGTYYLVETKAPTGYKLLSGYKAVTVADDELGTDPITIKHVAIANYLDNGLTLPQTGGIGTTIFTIGGGALILAAGIIFLISRKRKADESAK